MNIYNAQMLIDADKTEFNPFQWLIFCSSLPDAAKQKHYAAANISEPTPEQIKAHYAHLYIDIAYKKLNAALKTINPVLYPSNHIQYKLYKAITKNGFKVLKKVSTTSIKVAENTFILYGIDKRYHLYVNGYRY